ncbi:methyl- binding domain 1 L homeolog isoform X1 [Pelobates cultripes]|uniref:Methyl- binding domain 1 L homeolog isoform X1 n=1 Tax=Pelobates cultripes TaxID=61616 RepID=A0AAD1T332_PELCU|nr:methyl- binding domain 1 L homeolog isoform X1 [Pelobates cultripes]
MSEGWEDWPVLGPGWKRRQVIRKSGASCGNRDTYYQSPNGERVRSKIELSKLLGVEVDLSMFDFKNGVIIPHEDRKKLNRPSLPLQPSETSQPKKQRFSEPSQHDVELQNSVHESLDVQCMGCMQWFNGVEFGKSKQTNWYCADCRASRRALNREQKLLKNMGCGMCEPCKLTENCGHCTVCLLRFHNPEFGNSWKCVRRRCLKVLRKVDGCGTCEGCCSKKDCDICSVCIERLQNPDQQPMGTCLNRLCSNKTIVIQPSESKSFGAKKCTIKKTFVNQEKMKNEEKVAHNQEKNIPAFHKSPKYSMSLVRTKLEAVDTEYMETQYSEEETSPLRIPDMKQISQNGDNSSVDELYPIRVADIKEESSFTYEIKEEPLDNHCAGRIVSIEESDDIAEADESTPLIMEIFSLGKYDAITCLDQVLQEFMNELNEIPLPAYWEVQNNTAPNLQLVQRDKLSTMADTVIHIQPRFRFFVMVKGLPVPSTHELYLKHPSHLTSVYDVVELIGDLESYSPCPGMCTQGLRSATCRVLVKEERCTECCKIPWPSGSSF